MASRLPDGYEELGDDPDRTPLRPQAARQQPSALTQPLAGPGAAQGAAASATHDSSEPVLGVPAYSHPQQQHPGAGDPHQQAQQQGQQPFHSFPPYLDNLPPSAEQEWDRAALLMSLWLGCSAATLCLALLTFNVLAIVAGVCATVGAATHRFAWCRPASMGRDLGALVGRVFGLALASASLSALVALMTFLIAVGLSATCGAADNPAGCAELTEVTLFFCIWFSVFTGVTGAVVQRMQHMRRLLNPVSSGMVNI